MRFKSLPSSISSKSLIYETLFEDNVVNNRHMIYASLERKLYDTCLYVNLNLHNDANKLLLTMRNLMS